MNGPNGLIPPKWLTLTLWMVKEVGVPVFLLLVFVGVFLGFLPSPMHTTLKVLEAHIASTNELAHSISALVASTTGYNAQQTSLLREICLQRAGSPEERRGCLR